MPSLADVILQGDDFPEDWQVYGDWLESRKERGSEHATELAKALHRRGQRALLVGFE